MSLAVKKMNLFLFFLRALFFARNLYHETMETSKKRQKLLMIYYSWFVLIYFPLEKIWRLFKSFEWIIFSESDDVGMKRKMFVHWLNLKTRLMGAGAKTLMEDKIDKKIISNLNNRSWKLLHNHFASAQFHSYFCLPFEWCEPSQ